MFAIRLLHTIPLVAALGTAAACTSESEAQKADKLGKESVAIQRPQASRDPCSLITKEEAEAIFEAKLTVKQAVRKGPPTCEYTPAEGRKANGFALTVYWRGGKDAMATTKAGARIAKGAMKSTNTLDPMAMMSLEPIDDLGDEAYFSPVMGSFVLKDDTMLEFDIRMLMWKQSKEGGKARWTQLVTKALARL